jgi:proteasome accessory factor A
MKLKCGDLPGLVGRLDWVLKLYSLERAMDLDSKLNWQSPEIKHLDHLYSNLARAEGLYWKYEAAGMVERLVSEADILRYMKSPPTDTRAWTRTMLLRCAIKLELEIEDVDWDRVRFRSRNGTASRTIELANPLGFTQAQAESVFRGAKTLKNIFDGIDALGARIPPDPTATENMQGEMTHAPS